MGKILQKRQQVIFHKILSMSSSQPTHDPIWGRRGASLAPSNSSGDKYSILSAKEKQIIQECQDEAFYYRSVPLAVCFSFGTHSLHDLGQLKPFIFERLPPTLVKWGMVCGAGALGFWLGQFAYSNHCVSKFLERAPEGVIAMDIRMKGINLQVCVLSFCITTMIFFP